MRPPTLSEVECYCRDKGYSVNPARFFRYYDNKGWKVNGEPIANWKGLLRYWQDNQFENDKQHQEPQGNPNFDVSDIEQRMLFNTPKG